MPTAALASAAEIHFAGDTDSNSPAVWDLVDGSRTLFVMNSVAGWAHLSAGRRVARLNAVGPISWSTAAPLGGAWMEAIVTDEAGGWYGFYHNEMHTTACPGSSKVSVRIGAARSADRGLTWEDLGPILEGDPVNVRCHTNNHYFVGGVGDLSVALDHDRAYLYVLYSQYIEQPGLTGITVARMAWAARDTPQGQVDVWQAGAWLPPTLVTRVARHPLVSALGSERGEAADDRDGSMETWTYPLATPIYASDNTWDDERPGVAVPWGPSVHWNTYLQSWVMLFNKAGGDEFEQEGIYVAFNPAIENPNGWSTPVRLLEGGRWYPQVIGTEPGQGTDKEAGAVARFYMGGTSIHTIRFFP